MEMGCSHTILKIPGYELSLDANTSDETALFDLSLGSGFRTGYRKVCQVVRREYRIVRHEIAYTHVVSQVIADDIMAIIE